MSSESAQIRVLQAIGLTTSAFLGGAVLAMSYAAIPPLYSAPSPLSAKQWRVLYRRGVVVAPPFAALTSAIFGYLSYTLKQTSRPNAEFYGLAAASVIGIVPYTLLVMKGTNDKLMARAVEAEKLDVTDKVTQAGMPKGESTNELLDRWAFYNAIRGVFPLMATALGMWATLA
ncbi:hypothetical protein MMC18_002814 [Xylographa bjoerkii]|nr:hypothetical protein [Xylographa bjoerkii]